MAQKRQLALVFPAGGLDRYLSFKQQRPFTSPELLNVRPKDTHEGRERGGSRPGVGKAFYSDLGTNVNLLGQVPVLLDNTGVGGVPASAATSNRTFWADNFLGESVGSIWASASWFGAGTVAVPAGTTRAGIGYGDTKAGVAHGGLSSFDTAKVYDLQVFIAPYHGTFGGKYSIFARMDDSTPVGTTDGVVVELVTTGIDGAYSGSVTEYASGSGSATAFSSGSLGAVKAGWLRVEITGSPCKVYWHGTLLATKSLGSAAGKRFGFGVEATSSGSRTDIDTFLVNYARSDALTTQNNRIVVGAGGTVKVEERIGQLSAVLGSLTISSDRPIMMADRGQKAYIADWGDPKANGADGVAAGTDFDSPSIADWSALGIDTDDDVLVVFSAAAGVTEGTYAISSVASGSLTLSSSAGTGSGNSFRVERGAKVLDAKGKSFTLWTATAGKGTVPAGNPLIARYRDRMVLAGARHNPIVWQMSRQGDPLDWDFAGDAEDVQKAVLGTSAEAGDIAEPITALIAYDDDNLIFGARHSLWLLRGDPLFGGQIDNLSETVGILDGNAWCRVSDGSICFLSRDGLYMMSGVQAGPQSASRERMPEELRDIDSELYHINIEWDVRDRGVHIFITPKDTRVVKCFWFDWTSKSFYPAQYASDHMPITTLAHEGSFSERTAVLMGCKDGYVRRHHDLFDNDDGTAITSKVVYGPFRPGIDEYHEGVLSELTGTLSSDSGKVLVEVKTGTTFEEAAALTGSAATADAFFSATWESGINIRSRPRARGGAFTITLSGTTPAGEGMRAWSIERILAVIKQAGEQRTEFGAGGGNG